VTGGLRLTSYRDGSKSAAPPRASAGDQVECLARAHIVRNFGNPGSFDYREFLERQDIQLEGSLRSDELLTIVVSSHVSISDPLARARGRLLNSIDELLASRPDEAALARAMLLGDRSFVEHDRIVEFQKTGVYHVMVLAGLHVGALTAFFIWAGRRLRLALFSRTLLTLAVLAAHAGIVEDRPPIVRAVLMAAVYLFARLLFRRMDLLNIAALSALAILVVCPSEITDASFLLSFSAVATIGAIAVPWIANTSEPFLRGLSHLTDVSRDVIHSPRVIQFRMELRTAASWLSTRLPTYAAPYGSNLVAAPLRIGFYLWELMVLSAILQLGMLPSMTYYFHRVTLVGPFANVSAVVLTGLAVPIGFFTLAASLVSRPVAGVLAKLLGFILAMLDTTVQWFSKWHGASYRIPGPPIVLIAIFAALAILLSVVVRSRTGGWRQWAAAIPFLAAAALIATFPFAPRLAVNELQLTVLDVGQGDSLFLTFPGGHTMLVDGGGDLTSFYSGGMRAGMDIGEEVVSPYLWSRGIKKIDIITLTHAHQDHLGGLPAILENFEVRELWVGRDINIAAYHHVLAAAREHGVRILHKKQGESFNLDGVAGSILWPDNLDESKTANNNDSLVIRLTDGSQSFLLAGDIERPSERKILAEEQTVDVNFLKVAHHGSKTSTIEQFLSAAHPGFAAISVGKDNSFGHPSPEVIERLQAAGVRVYRTDLDGAITATTNGRTLGVSTFVSPKPQGNARFIAATP
jgi:competence protein ComEC